MDRLPSVHTVVFGAAGGAEWYLNEEVEVWLTGAKTWTPAYVSLMGTVGSARPRPRPVLVLVLVLS